jgi:GAF domain-containing protein
MNGRSSREKPNHRPIRADFFRRPSDPDHARTQPGLPRYDPLAAQKRRRPGPGVSCPGSDADPRHCKTIEDGFALKSTRILCYPLFLKEKDHVYGAVEIIDTTPERIRLKLEKNYLKFLEHIVNICSIALGNATLVSRIRKLDIQRNPE